MRSVTIRVLLIAGAIALSYAIHWAFQDRFQLWNDQVVDRLYNLRATEPETTRLNIIQIDANFYFDRPFHAKIISDLARLNISYQLIDTVFSGRIGPESDQPLIAETSAADNVFHGMKFETLITRPSDAARNLSDSTRDNRIPTSWPVKLSGDFSEITIGVNPITPFDELAAVSRGIGTINLTPDNDGILRRVPLLIRYRGALYPSITLRVVSAHLGVAPDHISVIAGKAIKLDRRASSSRPSETPIVIPIDPNGNMLLNNTGYFSRVPHFSYSDIRQASEQIETRTELSGKIAVLSENVETPYQIRTDGGYANVPSGAAHIITLHNILTQSFIGRLPSVYALAIELLLLAILFGATLNRSTLTLSLGYTVTVVGYVGFGVLLFAASGIIVSFFRPVVSLSLATFFLFVLNAIHSALLRAEEEKAKRIAERELEIGRDIQAGFLPATLPVPEGWEIETHFQPARHVAGDFFDVFTFKGDEKIGIVVADVCGKGVGAALFMALFRSLIRVLAGSVDSDRVPDFLTGMQASETRIADAIGSVNDYIATTHERATMFATVFFGILDPHSGRLHYINGGHEPPLVKGPEGIKFELKPTGPAVGLFKEVEFKVDKIDLEPGDILVAFTDGVTDAQNPKGEFFTRKRLHEYLTNSNTSARSLLDDIQKLIDTHMNGSHLFDDITILALKRK